MSYSVSTPSKKGKGETNKKKFVKITGGKNFRENLTHIFALMISL